MSRVVESNHPDYKPGAGCWATVDGRTMTYPVVMNWETWRSSAKSIVVAGCAGDASFTAYMGLLDIGQPKEGETLVLLRRQVLWGRRWVKSANLKLQGGGGCRWRGKMPPCYRGVGFDVCLDHHADDFAEQLAKGARKALISIMKTLAVRYSMRATVT